MNKNLNRLVKEPDSCWVGVYLLVISLTDVEIEEKYRIKHA